MVVLGSWVYGAHARGWVRAVYRRRWGGETKDTYRYLIHAYEDARWKRLISHQHGGSTTVLDDGASALERAELLAREFRGGWVYIHVEYRGRKE
jgi:hypothetical protein